MRIEVEILTVSCSLENELGSSHCVRGIRMMQSSNLNERPKRQKLLTLHTGSAPTREAGLPAGLVTPRLQEPSLLVCSW